MTQKRSCLYLLLLSSVLAGPAPAPVAAAEGEGKSFVEKFATLDPARWYVSDGWSNGPHQNCTWQRSRIHIGLHGLSLELADVPAKDKPYSCAEVQTLQYYGYGTYETRLRSVAAPGMVTAFFTYTGPPIPDTPHDEIDFEFLGKDPKSVQLNFFSDGEGGHEFVPHFDFNAAEGFNDYAFEWLPDRLRWFVNGKVVHEVKAVAGKRFPSAPSKIIVSLWNGSDQLNQWLDKFAYPGQPLVATYEYVAFTKQGDPCQFPTSIVCQTKAGAPSP